MNDADQGQETASATGFVRKLTDFIKSLQALVIAIGGLSAAVVAVFIHGPFNAGIAESLQDAQTSDAAEYNQEERPEDIADQAAVPDAADGENTPANAGESEPASADTIQPGEAESAIPTPQNPVEPAPETEFVEEWSNERIGVPNRLQGVRYGKELQPVDTMVYVDGVDGQTCRISVVSPTGEATDRALTIDNPVIIQAERDIRITLNSIGRAGLTRWRHCFFTAELEVSD